MKGYYLFLNSVVNEYYKNNKFWDFTVILPENIDLSDKEWELALCEVYFI